MAGVDADLAGALAYFLAGGIRLHEEEGVPYHPAVVPVAAALAELSRKLSHLRDVGALASDAGRDDVVVGGLDPAQVARVAGVHRSTLFRAWAQGRGPRSTIVHGRRVVTLADLLDWLEERAAA